MERIERIDSVFVLGHTAERGNALMLRGERSAAC
jgi:hypothetical protein